MEQLELPHTLSSDQEQAKNNQEVRRELLQYLVDHRLIGATAAAMAARDYGIDPKTLHLADLFF